MPKRFSVVQFFSLFLLDGLGVLLSFLAALFFRFDGQVPPYFLSAFIATIPAIILLYCLVNLPFKLYTHIWRYANAQEVTTIVSAAGLSTALLLAVIYHKRLLPLSVVLLGGLLTAVAFIVVRYRQRLLTGSIRRLQTLVGSPNRQRILIVGAGESGQFLARQIQSCRQHYEYELVGFVDDDPRKLGLYVQGVPVLGSHQAIPHLVTERKVGLIVIAIHNISGMAMRNILSTCLKTEAQVKILPDFLGNINNLNGSLPLKNISPEDLLGRALHQVDETSCRELIAGKVVLVTGAAGSIGSELSRQILKLQPRRLLLLDNNETGLHDLILVLENCLSDTFQVEWKEGHDIIKPIVADITRQKRLQKIFATHQPDLVFHAAAYKHVPLLEQHADEAVLVNIWGTYLAAQLAAAYGAERFLLISTDKAVAPTSIMGATKHVCEMIVTHMIPNLPAKATSPGPNGRQGRRRTRFTAVRFGNVLGSRGSVVPTFTRQIELGGPVTITHPEMTRYFMSLSEAVSLVIQAATLTEGEEIFMLDMGQKIRILDLAHKMIRLRGLRPGPDIPITYTGIRPGEKLHERLVAPHEKQYPTIHPKIFRLYQPGEPEAAQLARHIFNLVHLAQNGPEEELKETLWQLVQAKTTDKKEPSYPVEEPVSNPL